MVEFQVAFKPDSDPSPVELFEPHGGLWEPNDGLWADVQDLLTKAISDGTCPRCLGTGRVATQLNTLTPASAHRSDQRSQIIEILKERIDDEDSIPEVWSQGGVGYALVGLAAELLEKNERIWVWKEGLQREHDHMRRLGRRLFNALSPDEFGTCPICKMTVRDPNGEKHPHREGCAAFLARQPDPHRPVEG